MEVITLSCGAPSRGLPNRVQAVGKNPVATTRRPSPQRPHCPQDGGWLCPHVFSSLNINTFSESMCLRLDTFFRVTWGPCLKMQNCGPPRDHGSPRSQIPGISVCHGAFAVKFENHRLDGVTEIHKCWCGLALSYSLKGRLYQIWFPSQATCSLKS